MSLTKNLIIRSLDNSIVLLAAVAFQLVSNKNKLTETTFCSININRNVLNIDRHKLFYFLFAFSPTEKKEIITVFSQRENDV